MSIEKIRGNDPHEPEGSHRKMRNVGDQYKRIERTGEVDPENRKKQKWENLNDSPMDLPKKTSSLGSSGPASTSDPYDSYANKSSSESQNRSNTSSNPYNSQNYQNSSNSSSSNAPSSSSDTSKSSDSTNSKTGKTDDKKGDKKLPGLIIEDDEIILPPTQDSHLKGSGVNVSPHLAHGKTSKEPLTPHKLKQVDENKEKEQAHQLPTSHAKPIKKEPVKAPLHTQAPEQKKQSPTEGSEVRTGAKDDEKPKDRKDPLKPSDKAPLPVDLGQKTPQPIQAPPIANISGPIPTVHSVSSQLSHPEISRLFTQLVSHLTATAHKGVKEVTITLSSGTFKGSQIIITETSTALRNYNIQLLGATNEASSLFAAHASELMQSFQSKPFPFKVNRIDPGHLIRRKEDIGKEDTNDDNQEG
jgi:hypothetical protein